MARRKSTNPNKFETKDTRYLRIAGQWTAYPKTKKGTLTGDSYDLTWKQVKIRFHEAYDRKFARRLARIHGTRIEDEYKKVRNARRKGIHFKELY